MVVIVDEQVVQRVRSRVSIAGGNHAVCHEHTARTIAELPSLAGCEAVVRMGSSSTNKPDGDNIAVTDNGNYIVDLHFKEPIKDVNKAASDLKNTVGVVDHGLFVGMSYQVIVAGSDGIGVAGTDGESSGNLNKHSADGEKRF